WSHSREIPLGSVAVQRTRTGTVDPRILPEIRPVVGAITVGAIPSAITRFTFVVRVMPEDVPVIVNGYVPTGVAAGSEAVVTVSTDPASALGFSLNVPVVPAGRPLTWSATSDVKLIRWIAT